MTIKCNHQKADITQGLSAVSISQNPTITIPGKPITPNTSGSIPCKTRIQAILSKLNLFAAYWSAELIAMYRPVKACSIRFVTTGLFLYLPYISLDV